MAKFFNSISRIGLLIAALLLTGLAWAEPSWAVDNLRLTSEAQDQHRPTVSGSRIVWQDDYAGKSRIYGLKIGAAPVRLTDSSGNDRLPRIDGGIVVFERRSAPGALVDSDIWMYRFSTGAASVVSNNAGAQYGPDISGDRVVWYQFNALTGWDIMIKDLSTGSVYQLTKDPGRSLNPRISKNHVVWTDDRFEQFDIFSYDLNEDSDGDGIPNYREDSKPWPDPALLRLTSGAAKDDKPDIDNGRVVWRSFQGDEYKLYWYDLAAPGAGVRWVRTVRGVGAKPSITISGNRLVFTDVPAGADPNLNVDLYTRNLVSGLTTRVTSYGYRQEAPELNGNRLVYQDNRHGWQWDVYLADFDSQDSAPPGTVVVDTQKPIAQMETPFVSTKTSKRPTFKVKWSGTDPAPSSLIKGYTVRYRPSTSRKWRTWKSNTKSTSALFEGKAGVTYYFRVKATDNAGNYGWSKVRKTIVPFNEGIFLRKIGFNGYQKLGRSQNYLTSVRYSYKRGHTLVYKLYRNNGIGLIVTKGSKMGKAKIYVDGKYVKTVDASSSKIRPRQLIFYRGFKKKGTHYLKVVNLGTPGRARFEIDAIVTGR